MKILVDSNVIVRCSVGRAGLDVVGLRRRNVTLATTTRNIAESIKVLVNVFKVPEELATDEISDAVSAFEIYDEGEFDESRKAAQERLHDRAQPDWPVLAAALTLDADIWSDDRDFFGVGVPVWTTRNIRFAEGQTQ